MTRKQTDAQREADRRRSKTRPGRVVAARLDEEETRAYEAQRGDESPSTFTRALIRRALGINTPLAPKPKTRRAKRPSAK